MKGLKRCCQPFRHINVESDALDFCTVGIEGELEMFFSDDAMAANREMSIKQRLWKVLTPGPSTRQLLCQQQSKIAGRQSAIAVLSSLGRGMIQGAGNRVIERLLEAIQILPRQAQAGRNRKTADLRQQSGMPGRH